MCIIAIKQAKQQPFQESLIRTMFDNNPDGAGYMTIDNDRVVIRKGYMKVEHLISSLKSVSPDLPLILHFRIATHGGVSQGLCHPFPVISELSKMRAKKTKCNIGMVHNGIISCADSSHDVSDTMDYIQSVVSPLLSLSPHALQSDLGKSILATTCGSKLAFLDSKGRITTIGDFQLYDGYLFSNGSYKERVWMPPTKTHFYSKHTGYTSALYDTYDPYTDEYTDEYLLPLMVIDEEYELRYVDGKVVIGETWVHAISSTGGVYEIQADGFTASHVPNVKAYTIDGKALDFKQAEAEMFYIE